MKKRGLKIIVCILIAIVLVAGMALALSLGIRNARAVVKLGDITVDSGTVTYLASRYKMIYLDSLRENGVDCSDSQEFWQSEMADGISFGEDFELSFKGYVRSLVADGYLYITYHGYTAEDKLRVAEKNDAILREYAHGSAAEFNDVAEEYGFDYNDFQNAYALIYKAERARELLPESLGAENYEKARDEALVAVDFNGAYDIIKLLEIPLINDYYAR